MTDELTAGFGGNLTGSPENSPPIVEGETLNHGFGGNNEATTSEPKPTVIEGEFLTHGFGGNPEPPTPATADKETQP